MKKILLTLIVFWELYSCDTTIQYQMIIVNNTTDTITFFFSEQTHYYKQFDTAICNPFSKIIFFEETVLSGKYDCDPQIISNEIKIKIKIKINSGKILTKDISNSNNWYCEGGNDKDWKIIFEINEEDLE